jgi:hypothetical protein
LGEDGRILRRTSNVIPVTGCGGSQMAVRLSALWASHALLPRVELVSLLQISVNKHEGKRLLGQLE